VAAGTDTGLDDGRARQTSCLAKILQCYKTFAQISERLAGAAIKINVKRFESYCVVGCTSFFGIAVLGDCEKCVEVLAYQGICNCTQPLDVVYKPLPYYIFLVYLLDSDRAILLACIQRWEHQREKLGPRNH